MTLSKILETFADEKRIVKSEKDGKYVEKSKAGVSLKGVLQRGRAKLGRERPQRKIGVSFQPSSITYNYCRRLKIAQLAGLTDIYYKSFPPREQTVMDIGSAIHEVFQNYFWDLGILKGTFRCLKCDKNYHDLVSPLECPSGIKSHTREHLVYREVKMGNKEFLVFGRCDGILLIEEEEHLVDIKSIKARTLKTTDREFCFEDLDRGPKPDHVIQVQLYLWMSKKEHGHLLYVNKNTGQIRTFYIPFDSTELAPFLEEITDLMITANKIKSGEKVDLPIPCGREDCPCHEVV